MRRKIILVFLLVSMSLQLMTCTSGAKKSGSDYKDDILTMRNRLRDDPGNARLQRDLGILYFLSRQYNGALEQLRAALETRPEDPKTLYYLGLTEEITGDDNQALERYKKYARISRVSPYRKRLEGRYRWLTNKRIHTAIKERVAQEDQISDREILSRTVAVFPLNYQGMQERLAPLGRGLSEMIMIDLGRVESLTVVERVRLQALLDELALVEKEVVNPKTAPKMGKILRAAKLVHGSYSDLTEKDIRMDIAAWDIKTGKFPDARSGQDLIDNIFQLEKRLVFDVIADLGIELTEAQRRKIQFVPTRNLEAFLAYSLGLQEEDGGRYRNAATHYQAALRLDPNFTLAKLRAEAAQGLSEAGGPIEEAVESAQFADLGPFNDILDQWLDNRLDKIGTSLGSGFVPGEDSRQGPDEVVRGGGRLGPGEFPEPPPPPPINR